MTRPGGIDRRRLLLGALGTVTGAMIGHTVARADAQAHQPLPGDHETLADLARALSRRGPRGPRMTLAGPFAGLDYDSHRGIRPRAGGAGDLPLGPEFRADLMPPGFLLRDRVAVTLGSADGSARRIPFGADLFDFDPRYFGRSDLPLADADAAAMGFAGLRLRHPLNAPGVLDEVAVFQGASYFRALGRGNLYGLSARGLALGTGGPGPEEFPVFTHLRADPAGPGRVQVAALMESASVTGAFSIEIAPGAPTVMAIHASLFPRRDLTAAGIAPLTSMYHFGPMRRAVADDFRPAVHDSDGLRVLNGAGEWLWRPLANPAQLQVSALLDTGPQGFGLVQSRSDFAAFEDAEAGYHRRPSAWVEPLDDWGPGAVTLVEIPTADEFADNIVAFWRPAEPLAAGQRHDFRYRLSWGDAPAPPLPHPARQSMSGRAILDPEALSVVVDFDGTMPDDVCRPELQVSGAGSYGLTCYAVPEAGVTRVSFKLVPGGSDLAEIRLVLRDTAGRALSDTWLYRWSRARDGGI